jgi:hypothetical protein
MDFDASEAAVYALRASRAAIDVTEDRDEIAPQRTGQLAGSCIFHGCFLAAEAMDAATSVAMAIWASRSLSW